MPELDRWRIVQEPPPELLRLLTMPMPGHRMDWTFHSSWDSEKCKCGGFACCCGADNRCETCQTGGYHDMCHECAKECSFPVCR